MYDKTQCIEPQYDAEGNVIPLDDSVVEQLGFGERVAEQVDASVEANRAEARMQTAGSIDAHVEDEGPRAWETDYHEKLETMDFDERVQATTDCLSRRHTFTDILYGLLGFCVDEKSYEEIEPYVESFTEFHRNR